MSRKKLKKKFPYFWFAYWAVLHVQRGKKISQWNSSLWNSSSTGKNRPKQSTPLGLNRAFSTFREKKISKWNLSLWNSSSTGKNRASSYPSQPKQSIQNIQEKKNFQVELESMKLEFHRENRASSFPSRPKQSIQFRGKKISQWNSSLWNSSSTGENRASSYPSRPK